MKPWYCGSDCKIGTAKFSSWIVRTFGLSRVGCRARPRWLTDIAFAYRQYEQADVTFALVQWQCKQDRRLTDIAFAYHQCENAHWLTNAPAQRVSHNLRRISPHDGDKDGEIWRKTESRLPVCADSIIFTQITRRQLISSSSIMTA